MTLRSIAQISRLAAIALLALGGLLAVAASAAAERASIPFDDTLDWPETQRVFVQDGPGYLLSADTMRELLESDEATRDRIIEAFLRDPDPSTPENEMEQAIERRRGLVRAELRSFQDARAQLLFLHGTPTERVVIDCAETFKPMELWTYGGQTLIVFRPSLDAPWALWLPVLSKRALYTDEMTYYLEQWHELERFISASKRIDRYFCRESKQIDRLTGVDALFGFEEGRPRDEVFARFLEPPADRAAWAARAAGTEVPPSEELPAAELEVFYPERTGQRMKTLLRVELPDTSILEPVDLGGDKRELRLVVDGHLEREGSYFEEFRIRFQVPLEDGAIVDPLSQPLVLLSERLLRPYETFLLRLQVTEEITGRVARFSRALAVPAVAEPLPEPVVTKDAIQALSEELATQRIAGYDSLVLIPPATDVVFGLWRAEALVTGERIERVKFLVDGTQQLARRGPPFTAELRLETQPREQVVVAEGYDAQGELVASDEVVVNQPRGELRVRITRPARGAQLAGTVTARAEITVPEEKVVRAVTFLVDDTPQLELQQPPWEGPIEVPADTELSYLTVVAELDDGTRAEDVRFLNAPDYIEEVDVNLVELFTTVTDKRGQLVFGLSQDEFQVLEDGRPQTIEKFELVENLPLSLGITIDTSGSMLQSLGEAQRAAVGFLDEVIGPRDRVFALAFSDRPALLMPRTSDVGAVAETLEGLVADGATALHDAVVTSLYYYRGIRGRRALVLLSDGEDTMSSLGFSEVLEYARRSGVTIYSIGLGIGRTDIGIRRKLTDLAEVTGGRLFLIDEASELEAVYAQIERELRSQYLVAYASNAPSGDSDEYREVEVEVRDGDLKARTLAGYYP
ncbi:MAG: VWA domain-containing protein [Acidobacteriota bacterium]